MKFPWFFLESCTQTNTKDNVKSRRCKIQQEPNHFFVLGSIHLLRFLVQSKIYGWMHWGIHFLYIVYIEFFQQFLHILSLMNVYSFGSFLDLQTKEEFQFSHHTLFKLSLLVESNLWKLTLPYFSLSYHSRLIYF